jgi:hypothetical protein
MNRLAPSTIYLNLGTPLSSNILWTFEEFIDSGLPPHGIKKSALILLFKWKVFLNLVPDYTNVPSGRSLFSSLTLTKYPLGDNFP